MYRDSRNYPYVTQPVPNLPSASDGVVNLQNPGKELKLENPS